MKTLLTGLAIFIVLAFSVYFQNDYSRVERTELALKNDIDEAASGAVLMFDAEEFAEGNIVINDSEALEYVQHIADDQYGYILHIFDDSLTHRQYGNEGNSTSSAITFPYDFIDSTGYTTEISEPAVIIEAWVSGQLYTLDNLKDVKTEVKRSTMYVVEGR